MIPSSKTVVFFGTDHFSAVSLHELIDKGFSIAAVVTKPDSKKGRGRQLSKSLVKEIAEAHHISVWQPEKASDLAMPLQELAAEKGEKPIGVLVSYGKIIPESIIDLFEPGIVNVHPSLLPLYRGPSPIESAILHGDTETGVTIMQLSKEMDAGPLYAQTVVTLNDTETTPELEQKLAELGAQELTIALPKIISGTLQPVPQADDLASYCSLLKKEAGLLDPATVTAEQAERRVRAYITFPKTKVTIAGHQIVIVKAHVSSSGTTMVDLQCADGRYLSIDELVGPSGRTMTAKAFLNGYRTQA